MTIGALNMILEAEKVVLKLNLGQILAGVWITVPRKTNVQMD